MSVFLACVLAWNYNMNRNKAAYIKYVGEGWWRTLQIFPKKKFVAQETID